VNVFNSLSTPREFHLEDANEFLSRKNAQKWIWKIFWIVQMPSKSFKKIQNHPFNSVAFEENPCIKQLVLPRIPAHFPFSHQSLEYPCKIPPRFKFEHISTYQYFPKQLPFVRNKGFCPLKTSLGFRADIQKSLSSFGLRQQGVELLGCEITGPTLHQRVVRECFCWWQIFQKKAEDSGKNWRAKKVL